MTTQQQALDCLQIAAVAGLVYRRPRPSFLVLLLVAALLL